MILIVGATGDPVTPYPGQVAMHRALTGSRMLTLQGAYTHGVALFEGNPCVDAAVEAYLVSGDYDYLLRVAVKDTRDSVGPAKPVRAGSAARAAKTSWSATTSASSTGASMSRSRAAIRVARWRI